MTTPIDNADNAIRQCERDVMFSSSFDADKHAAKRATASAALAELEQLRLEPAVIEPLRLRFGEMAQKADAILIDAFKSSIDSAQRGAARELTSFEDARERYKPKDLEPNDTGKKVEEWAAKVRTAIDTGGAQLVSERGRAVVAEAEAWLLEVDRKIADLQLASEAFAAFRTEAEVATMGSMSLVAALDSTEWNFKQDAERVVLVWDVVKKLIRGLDDPRFAEIKEVAAAVTRYRWLEVRVATELRPMLAKVRVAPLVRTAASSLQRLERETDAMNEDSVLASRKALRAAIAPLERDWADDADAQDFLAECKRAFRRSEEDLGDRLVLREIHAAEIHVKPLVDRVEQALAIGSLPRIREHAPRLRARLAELAPFLSAQRAYLLDDRARAALERIEEVFGADVAREVAEAEAVPQFAIDIAMDAKVQDVLGKIGRAFESYAAEYTKAQESFEANVDVIAATTPFHAAYKDVESAADAMIRSARSAEKCADELRRVDRAHPAIAVVEAAAPKLVKRAQAWKARSAKRFDYAKAIEQARWSFCQLETGRAQAARGTPHDAVVGWTEVLDRIGQVDQAVATAAELLPDDRDEADAWAAKAAGLRREAATTLRRVCLAEATRGALANDNTGAQRYADALRMALPDAPENAQIAAAITGTADARQRAEVEVQTRGDLIGKRAEAAVQAFRPMFDAWAADKAPLTALAGSIVANIENYRGKWIAIEATSLGVVLYDEPYTIDGDIYQVDYSPWVRRHVVEGMKRLDALYAEMATKVGENHGVTGMSTASYHTARGARLVCEIVGIASYTPRTEVKDNTGRVIHTIAHPSHPVPRAIIQAVVSGHFAVIPDRAPSLDALDVTGILD